VFGVCFWLLGRLDPLAFNETGLSLARATYFSFVTLATLGYRDILPRNELVQSLVIIEAVGGQMYLAVLIARLVSPVLQAVGDMTSSQQARSSPLTVWHGICAWGIHRTRRINLFAARGGRA
jgi:hypothetical protein